MIAFDFEYYKPSSIAEAIGTFNVFREKGKSVMFYFWRYGVHYLCAGE